MRKMVNVSFVGIGFFISDCVFSLCTVGAERKTGSIL